MEKDKFLSVKDAVFKLQLYLLEGLQNEDQLYGAGSLISCSDYKDVVIERSIANLCGYPLCRNSLSLNHLHKHRYRISVKEHKVYDLQDSHMYCCTNCVVSSQSFARSLCKGRPSVIDPSRLNKVMALFESFDLHCCSLEKTEDFGFGNLKIQEKKESRVTELCIKQSVLSSYAIEGYIPRRNLPNKPSTFENLEECSNPSKIGLFKDPDVISSVINSCEYNISKNQLPLICFDYGLEAQEEKGKGVANNSKEEVLERTKCDSCQSPTLMVSRTQSELASRPLASSNSCQIKVDCNASSIDDVSLKSCLKGYNPKKVGASVSWADKNVDSSRLGQLCDVEELERGSANSSVYHIDSCYADADSNVVRLKSAEACASALKQAASAVSLRNVDVSDAMWEAGVTILSNSHDLKEENSMDQPSSIIHEFHLDEVSDSQLSDDGAHDVLEDSWYDSPPDRCNLTFSSFATIWMALLGWITSSSLAYIYGKNDSFHECFVSVNGREYPRKFVLQDGRSSEIKKTVEACLARVTPMLVTELRLPIAISVLEQGMVHLMATMSFVDALPALKMRQWQVIALLFLEALSLHRLAAVVSHLSNRKMMIRQMLDNAQLGAEEYEAMVELVIPLGRSPILDDA